MDSRPRTESGRIKVTVGQAEGDLRGDGHRVIQAAIDYVAGLGGGVVHILGGVYWMEDSLRVRSGVNLLGEGAKTVLEKCGSKRQNLVRDSDWYEARVELADASEFTPGSGIMLRSFDGHEKLRSVVRETVTEVDGNVVALSGRLRSNMWLQDEACATRLFPLITADEETHDVTIEDITLDGNLTENEEINGNYSGGVFIQRCDRWIFRGVVSRNYNGDGFSFQVCDDIHFSHCRSEGNAYLGFHPGSGSQRPVFRDCISVNNNQGIFFCWGVSDGIVDGCTCSQNRDYGISIGHRDTDNRIMNSTIEKNHKVGVLFREEKAYRAGHRNVITSCVIRDNGFELEGVGVDVRGETQDVEISGNTIADSGHGRQKIGVRLGGKTDRIDAESNSFIKLEEDVESVTLKEEKGT